MKNAGSRCGQEVAACAVQGYCRYLDVDEGGGEAMRLFVAMAFAAVLAGCTQAPPDGLPATTWAEQAAAIRAGVEVVECRDDVLRVARIDEPAENQTPPGILPVNLTSFIGDGHYPMANFTIADGECVGVHALVHAQHRASTGLHYTSRFEGGGGCWWSGSGALLQHAATGDVTMRVGHICAAP